MASVLYAICFLQPGINRNFRMELKYAVRTGEREHEAESDFRGFSSCCWDTDLLCAEWQWELAPTSSSTSMAGGRLLALVGTPGGFSEDGLKVVVMRCQAWWPELSRASPGFKSS